MPRPCSICSSPEWIRIAQEMIVSGATDAAVAARLGGVSRVGVFRHRRNHLAKPLATLAAAADKGRQVREERDRVVKAAEEGDLVPGFITLGRIVSDLEAVHSRLDRMSSLAEASQQPTAVAGLAAQQLRAAEVRSRLGSVGGYSAAKTPAGATLPTFSVVFKFRGSEPERLDFHAVDTADVIDVTPLPVSSAGAMVAAEPDALEVGEREDDFEEEV